MDARHEGAPADPAAGNALHLLGSGSFAIEVAEWARGGGWNVVGLIEILDRSRVGTEVAGLPVIAPEAPPEGARAVVAVGGPRGERWSQIEAHGWRPATVVHCTAHVSPTATLAGGCIVAPGAVIGAETAVGAHALVSRGVLVGHHSRVGAFASLLPGANIGGHAEIGARTVVGMAAVVVNDVRVGCDATVAAGAVVLGATPDGVRVQGIPAREYAP
jgi:sugar O-acyltransferase (sialic acid O-acetyltransferase NeuD family)